MNQSLDGYIDYTAFGPSPALFRHFIDAAQPPSRFSLGVQLRPPMESAARSTARNPLNGGSHLVRIARGSLLMLLVMPVLAACSSQPAASASTQPASSASTQPANSAPASEPPTGNIQISAKNLNFEPDSVEIPAGTAFKIDFDNEDSATVHDIDIHLSNPGGEVVFDGATLSGPASATYDVPALAAGTYAFVCSVHPEMHGTMTAK